MPGPVLLGLPWLGTLLSGLFDTGIAWFLKYLGKKIAVVAATLAAWTAAFVALKAATIGAVAGASAAFPAEIFQMAGAIVPGNLGTVFSVIGATEAGCAIYKAAQRVIAIKSAI